MNQHKILNGDGNMTEEDFVEAAARRLRLVSEKTWADSSFKERYENTVGKVFDALHKNRPSDSFIVSNIAVAFYVAITMSVTVREGPENRYQKIQLKMLDKMLTEFSRDFNEGVKSISQYINALVNGSSDRFMLPGKNADSIEEGKVKSFEFWSLMWLGHQISSGYVKDEVLGRMIMPCAEFYPEFELFFLEGLTKLFGPAREMKTPMLMPSKTGCMIPLVVMFAGIGVTAIGLIKLL